MTDEETKNRMLAEAWHVLAWWKAEQGEATP